MRCELHGRWNDKALISVWNKEVPRRFVLGVYTLNVLFYSQITGYLLFSLKGGGKPSGSSKECLAKPACFPGYTCLSSSRAQLDAVQSIDWGGSGCMRAADTVDRWVTSENQDEVSEERCLLPWPIRACDGNELLRVSFGPVSIMWLNVWYHHLDHFQCQRGLGRELRMSLCGSCCS